MDAFREWGLGPYQGDAQQDGNPGSQKHLERRSDEIGNRNGTVLAVLENLGWE